VPVFIRGGRYAIRGVSVFSRWTRLPEILQVIQSKCNPLPVRYATCIQWASYRRGRRPFKGGGQPLVGVQSDAASGPFAAARAVGRATPLHLQRPPTRAACSALYTRNSSINARAGMQGQLHSPAHTDQLHSPSPGQGAVGSEQATDPCGRCLPGTHRTRQATDDLHTRCPPLKRLRRLPVAAGRLY
jgi:hypothetical protein